MPSFTTQNPNLQRYGPVVEVLLAVGSPLEEHLKGKGQPVPSPVQIRALVDTGASRTAVRQELVLGLGLQPVGTALIHTASSANVRCEEYLVRLVFPSNVVVDTVAIGAPLHGQDIDCLVGRDVLQQGVFVYIGYTNTFTLSF